MVKKCIMCNNLKEYYTKDKNKCDDCYEVPSPLSSLLSSTSLLKVSMMPVIRLKKVIMITNDNQEKLLKSIFCCFCFNSFPDSYNFNNHICNCKIIYNNDYDESGNGIKDQTIVNDKKVKRFDCMLCEKKFCLLGYFLRHVNNKHSVLVRNIKKCRYCAKACINKSELKKHELNHYKKIPIECSTCDDIDDDYEIIKYECPICRNSYDTNKDLKRHIKLFHSLPNESFYCNFCHKSLRSRLALIKHIRKLHIERHAYVCSVCNYSFWNSKNYLLHISKH